MTMKRLMILLLTAALALCVTAMAEAVDPALEEGYTVEGEGFQSVVSWCRNGEMNIFGRFYYPEGFDETKIWPTLIISHGLNSTADLVERARWPQAALAEGFVVYCFDFCGGSRNSRSDMDYFQMSVKTEIGDLNAVMDFVKAKPYVDGDRLFLMGQSQGGFVSAMTAAARSDEVKALVLVYPALCIVDDLHTFVPDISALEGDTFESAMGELGTPYAVDAYDIDVMAEIAAYTGDVLIIHGLNDKTVPYEYSLKAVTEAYDEATSELLLITGKKSTHGFEMVYDAGRDLALASGRAFLRAHLD